MENENIYDEGFKITNDNTADWALRVISDEMKEHDRLVDIAKDQITELENRIAQLDDSYNNKTSFLKSCLAEYFYKVPHKSTKTQEIYKLLSGSLVMKKPSLKINHNDDLLIENFKGTDFVKMVPKLKWSELKKDLTVVDDEVVSISTGEVISGCTIEEVPASFDVKL